MKKLISYTADFKMRYIFLILLFMSGLHMSAQNNTKQIMVSYGSPFSFSLGDNVTWEIKDEGGIVIFNGQGNVLVPGFEVPGHYKMTIHDNHTHDPGLCEHDHYPAEVDIEVKSGLMDIF